MHKKNAEIHIGYNVKIIQHDPEFENSNKGYGGDHLESTRSNPLATNIADNSARICHNQNVLEGHERS